MKPLSKALSLGIALLLSVLISIPALAVSVPYEIKRNGMTYQASYDSTSKTLYYKTVQTDEEDCLLYCHDQALPYMPDPNLPMNIRNVLLICGSEFVRFDGAFYYAASEAVTSGKVKTVYTYCLDEQKNGDSFAYDFDSKNGKPYGLDYHGVGLGKKNDWQIHIGGGTEFTYDSNGNISSVTSDLRGGAPEFTFHYKNGQLSSYDYGYFDDITKNIPIKFDNAGRVTKSFLTSYQYDNKGRLSTIRQEGISIVYTYNNQDQVIKSVVNNHALNETDIYTYRYTEI